MSEPLVLQERHGGAALLTLNQGARRNVLSAALVDALGAAYDALEADDSVHAVVLTGAGPAFCAGAELSVLRAAADGKFDDVRKVYEGFLRVLRSPLPTIAAVNGPAVGAGFNLTLACDVRLASRAAVFDTRFQKLRLHPGGGHAWLLARAVGPQHAMLATAFGQVWDAERAREVGLVASVHDPAELVPAALAIAQRMDGQESVFTRRLVDTMRRALGTPTHVEALAQETEAQLWSTTRPAFLEGLAAIERQVARTK
ncbi:MAG: Enoyl-CoA hydratase [Labilithrix sp.]|nr:Enoyl-CoA hydratase [Labilithrix sp.]